MKNSNIYILSFQILDNVNLTRKILEQNIENLEILRALLKNCEIKI